MTKIFGFTAGSDNVDFTDTTKYVLQDYNLKVPRYKGGGIFHDSPIADWRSLAFRKFANVTETIKLTIVGATPDELDANIGTLLGFIEKVSNYWVANENDIPYLSFKPDNQTNTQYALLVKLDLEELGKPYGPAYEGGVVVDGAPKNGMVDLTLGMERSTWQGLVPGQDECVQVSSLQEWEYNAEWLVNTTLPTGNVYSLLQTTTGRILAGNQGSILYSDDDGDTWATATSAPASDVRSLLQTTTGRILAGEFEKIYYSDDDGDTWAVLTTIDTSNFATSLLQTTTGRILAGISNTKILYSDDDGDTWATIVDFGDVSLVRLPLLQTTTGRILAGGYLKTWSSDDDGDTWVINGTLFGQYVYSFLQTTTAKILATSLDEIWQSIDNGTSWELSLNTGAGQAILSSFQVANGRIFAGEVGDIYVSGDDAYTWSVATTTPSSDVVSFLQTTSGKVLAGDTSQILELIEDTISLGNTATCDDIVYIGNKGNIANLTHIFIDDGGVFGPNLIPMTTFPVTLLPAVPALNDAVYFIIKTSIRNAGSFVNLIFDIATLASSTGSYTITWEYYQGSWTALDVQDGTNPGSGTFRQQGTGAVCFVPPSDWTTTAINSVTGYIIRARVSALAGTMTPPTQENRSIYTTVLPYIEIASSQIKGDIGALLRLKVRNVSDRDGVGGNAPDLYANRVIFGLKSESSLFQAYINLSDTQNPLGLSVLTGTGSAFATDVTTPSARRITYTADAAHTTFADRATIVFGSLIAGDFSGNYRVFLRAKQHDGSAGDIFLRLLVNSSSGGTPTASVIKVFSTTNDWQLIDFGQITISNKVLKSNELGDNTSVAIQAKNGSGATRTVYLYDIVCIPINECSFEATDTTNNSSSILGKASSIPKYLEVDSTINPFQKVRSIVRNQNTGLITSIYKTNPNNEVFLQPNVSQRYWFLAARYGDNDEWVSEPSMTHAIQVFKNQRYIGLRGTQ